MALALERSLGFVCTCGHSKFNHWPINDKTNHCNLETITSDICVQLDHARIYRWHQSIIQDLKAKSEEEFGHEEERTATLEATYKKAFERIRQKQKEVAENKATTMTAEENYKKALGRIRRRQTKVAGKKAMTMPASHTEGKNVSVQNVEGTYLQNINEREKNESEQKEERFKEEAEKVVTEAAPFLHKDVPETPNQFTKKSWLSKEFQCCSSLGRKLHAHVLGLCLDFAGDSSVVKLGLTGKYFSAVCENANFWKRALNHKCSHVSIKAGQIQNWKYAYYMCRDNIPNELRCCVTKRSVLERPGGGGIENQRGPVFGMIFVLESRRCLTFGSRFRSCIDINMRATFPCLTYDGMVRGFKNRTSKNSRFMPLFLSEVHFERSQPVFRRFCVDIASMMSEDTPCSGGMDGTPCAPALRTANSPFSPKLATDVLGAMLKGQQVESLIKDVTLVKCLCQIFRLLAACKKKWPSIEKAANTKLAKFMRSAHERSKKHLPWLLDVVIHLYVASSTFRWEDLMEPYLVEMLNRSMVQVCYDHPQEKFFKVSTSCSDSDHSDWLRLPHALARAFEANKEELKSTLLHVHFLQIVSRPTGPSELCSLLALDMFYGFARPSAVKRFQDSLDRINSLSSWQDYFELAGMKYSPNEMVSLLKH